MKLIQIGNYYSCVINGDGYIQYPYSHFINQKSNLGTRLVELKALRILDRYLSAHRIELATQCLNDEMLSYEQAREIRNLCWLPIKSLESMSDQILARLFKATSKTQPENNKAYVNRRTAAQRAETIARFLTHYEMYFVPQLSFSEDSRLKIKDNLRMVNNLLRSIKISDSNHHGEIVSLPTSKFISVIENVLKIPDKIFINDKSKISRNILRDQCIFLLACEGLRPGAIASIHIGLHYQQDSGYLDLSAQTNYLNSPWEPRSKGARSTSKAYSQPKLKVYPFTQKLIDLYIKTERAAILRKSATNNSKGRLFISERGRPIASSTTLKNIFTQSAKSLEKLGVIKIENDPHMRTSKSSGEDRYKLYAYVLRHSAASFFLAANGMSDATLDAMKSRFGWSRASNQPQRYAQRQYIDISNAVLHDHMSQLHELANVKKGTKSDEK
jgi:hypothetical protein